MAYLKEPTQERKAQVKQLFIYHLKRIKLVSDKVKKGFIPYQIQVNNFINSINF